MERNQKIQELLDRLDELEGKDPVRAIERRFVEDEGVSRETLRESRTGNALKILAKSLEKVQQDPRPDSLLKKLEEASKSNDERFSTIETDFAAKIENLLKEVQSSESRGQELTKAEKAKLLARLDEYQIVYDTDKQTATNQNSLLEAEIARIGQELPKILAKFDSLPNHSPALESASKDSQETKKALQSIDKELKAIEKRLANRINQIQQHGGGNANRNIAINGNTSVLSMFADINLKAGTGVTITYQVNQTTKYTDITIAATGGGGGITRQITSAAVNTVADGTAGIDQVYLMSGSVTLTLPTSVSNKNLYTVKNIGAGTVTINTTGGETIDGDTTVTMPLQYTSVDLISNNSGNWNIT